MKIITKILILYISVQCTRYSISIYTVQEFPFYLGIKGTVSVISSDPQYKDGNARFTTEILFVFISVSFHIASCKQEMHNSQS